MSPRTVLAALVVALLGALAAPAAAQRATARPTYGSVRLQAGFLPDPHTLSMTAGGSTRVSVSGCRYGYVTEAPDLILDYSGGSTLYLYARSSADTTLLVQLPDGRWMCDDDGLGSRNPLLVLSGARRGRYAIWVGTYANRLADASLLISEVNPR